MIENIFITASEISPLEIFMGSNAVNVIIMLVLLVLLLKKANIKGLLISKKEETIQEIEEAEQEKETAFTELNEIKEKVQHASKEIEEILNNSEKNAALIADEIVKDAEDQARRILAYADFNIENHREAVLTSLSDHVSKSAIDKAINDARKNIDRHQKEKSIDHFIDNLDQVIAGGKP